MYTSRKWYNRYRKLYLIHLTVKITIKDYNPSLQLQMTKWVTKNNSL